MAIQKIIKISCFLILFSLISFSFSYAGDCGIVYVDPTCQLFAGEEGGADVYVCEGDDGALFVICSSPASMGACAGPPTTCSGTYVW
ncbi:hypothetical protein [Algoriphagus yeomjeoni]|uniref:Uncharacterized protein n=1 Tax=Algoriphagus yeomjeoni TaxID=291403 RepID=A0A327PLB4_9BACT|nr:hypothetical protein [Algoriphagus yeomjeoni]RAI92064.1 hypothetical protein LV83_01291 [Algoriphagus yeomjeoni]